MTKVDLAAVRKKYAEESAKRQRVDKNEQYIEVKGEFSYFVEDPYTTESLNRDPLKDEKEVIIVGGGFGGLLAAVRLKKAGITDIRIVEKAGDFGGTWYWNRYPGIQCDIESYIYLPLLEETGTIPVHKYSRGSEIHEHTKRIADQYDLYEDVCFQTQVNNVSWNEEKQRWMVFTDQGDEMQAKFLCLANGPLNRPKLPGIEGINRFKGHTFHTARWDYEYTGGTSEGNLTKLADKKVAVIGTGATAIQCVPFLAKSAKQLYVVQRTPTAVDARNNAETDRDWFSSQKPGWQQKRIENFNNLISFVPQQEDLVADGWTDMVSKFSSLSLEKLFSGELKVNEMEELQELADYQSMEAIRQRVADLVEDSVTAESLKPYYRKFCKRPGFNDEYLQSFNRSNVTLIDTNGQGIERITESGFVVNGKEYEVDCIIFATGFEVGTDYTRRCGYEIIGKNGVALSEKWKERPKTLFGLQTNGFPNLFFMGPIHGSTGFNLTQMLGEQAKHHAHVISRAKSEKASLVDVDLTAEKSWGERVRATAGPRGKFFEACTPGYYNGEGGRQGKGGFWEHEYGGGPADFYNILRDWRETGGMEGLLLDGKPLAESSESLQHKKSLNSVKLKLFPEAKQLLQMFATMGMPKLGTIPAAQMREMGRASAALYSDGPEVHSVRSIEIESDGLSVPVTIFKPTPETKNIIVYYHGGAWCIGTPEEFDIPMRRLALSTGATVVFVDYRLAPEHLFPAAVDDAFAALKWVSGKKGELASANGSLFVAGDSAGGNLAASVSLLARDCTDPAHQNLHIAGQILLYPSVSGDIAAPWLDDFESPFLTKEEIVWAYEQYVPDPELRTDPRFAVLNAKNHQDLPPALIFSVEQDLLRGDAKAYARKLAGARVPVQLDSVEGTIHGYFSLANSSSHSKATMDSIARFMVSLDADKNKT